MSVDPSIGQHAQALKEVRIVVFCHSLNGSDWIALSQLWSLLKPDQPIPSDLKTRDWQDVGVRLDMLAKLKLTGYRAHSLAFKELHPLQISEHQVYWGDLWRSS